MIPSPFAHPAVRLLETRLASLAPPTSGGILRPADAAALLHELIGSSDREEFVALLLNTRHRVTHAHVVSRGALSSTTVHPREVFKAAVLANAAAIIVGHNHPSGCPRPSEEDKKVVARLRDAGELLGVTLLDALIVTPQGDFYSATEECFGKTALLLDRALEVADGPG